jgi:hypothetical protein
VLPFLYIIKAFIHPQVNLSSNKPLIIRKLNGLKVIMEFGIFWPNICINMTNDHSGMLEKGDPPEKVVSKAASLNLPLW